MIIFIPVFIFYFISLYKCNLILCFNEPIFYLISLLNMLFLLCCSEPIFYFIIFIPHYRIIFILVVFIIIFFLSNISLKLEYSESYTSQELSVCLCFCTFFVSLLFACDISALSGPESFNSQLFFFLLFFRFLKEHIVCEVLLVDAGAKKKQENKRVKE